MDAADLALVLAVDGSASVTYDEFGLIAGGMAAALRDAAVIAGLIGGPAKASYCCLLLWSGTGAQDVIADWTRIGSAADALAFADAVDNMPRTVPAGQTAIGEALLAALTLLGRVPANPKRSVVDVVGDGRSNQGIAPGPIRDRMASANITINGLCILHEEPDLLESYTREVIGGPGAFAVVCADYPDFFFFFKQKTAYEMDYCDWSSDVCSSDLMIRRPSGPVTPGGAGGPVWSTNPPAPRSPPSGAPWRLQARQRRLGGISTTYYDGCVDTGCPQGRSPAWRGTSGGPPCPGRSPSGSTPPPPGRRSMVAVKRCGSRGRTSIWPTGTSGPPTPQQWHRTPTVFLSGLCLRRSLWTQPSRALRRHG